MSKIIKPYDKETFRSAKRFRKKAFDLGARSAGGGENPHGPSQELDDNPGPKRVMNQPILDDPIAEAERRAEQITREADLKAEQGVREAERMADEIREKAREQGRTEALEEERKRVDEQLEASSRMLSSFIDQMKERESELMQSLTPRLAELATELARKIIHREVEKAPSLITLQAEEAIGKILEREKLIIRVNPSDRELMKRHKTALMRMFDGVDKIEVVDDPEIERGGCIVETNLIKVDAQPGSQLEAARKALLGGADT